MPHKRSRHLQRGQYSHQHKGFADQGPNSKIGRFTGFYYAASMLAQTITPIALGALLLHPDFSWQLLPVYALACIVIATIIFFFVKNVKNKKTSFSKGLDALGEADD